MTSHPIDLLAVYDDLPVQERSMVDAHLTRCSACHEIFAAYAKQDSALRGLPALHAPSSIRTGVRSAIHPDRHHRPYGRRFSTPLSVAAAAVLLAVSLLMPIPQHASTVVASGLPALRHYAAAAHRLGPYSGTALLDVWMLPPAQSLPGLEPFFGTHRTQLHWSIRDASHFRLDFTTVSPALQSGTVTYVLNGRRLLVYDHRTGIAGVGTLPPPRPTSIAYSIDPSLYTVTPPTILGLLSSQALAVGPISSISSYMATLRRQGADLHPPSYARLVETTRLLGHPSDVIEYGPLSRVDYITGCSFQHPRRCLHDPHGFGSARIWIGKDTPVVL